METQQQDLTQPQPYNAANDAPCDERLSAFELGELWEAYMADSSSMCLLQYFVAKTQDPEIRSILEYALQLSTGHVNTITQIFNSVNFPIPQGFTDEDVEPNAKRLFSDGYMLRYVHYVTRYGAVKYTKSLTTSTRPDVREFFNRCIDDIQDLDKKAREVLTKKGFFSEGVHIPIPDRIGYVYDDRSFYKSIFGDKRPINALEIAQVYRRCESRLIERVLVLGFSQTCKSQKVQKLFVKGKQVLDKQIERFSTILRDEELPIPIGLESEVTDSLESPISDKLMLFHTLSIIGYSLTALGISIASCTRADIVTAMNRTILETQFWAKDVLDLMIQSGWMEKIPQAADRKELVGLQH